MKTTIQLTCIILISIVFAIGCGLSYNALVTKTQHKTDNYYHNIYTQGVEAREAGVPVLANPYIGAPEEAAEWLQGWTSVQEPLPPSPPGLLR